MRNKRRLSGRSPLSRPRTSSRANHRMTLRFSKWLNNGLDVRAAKRLIADLLSDIVPRGVHETPTSREVAQCQSAILTMLGELDPPTRNPDRELPKVTLTF